MTEDEKQELRELQKMTESEGWRIYTRGTQAQIDHLRKHGWTSIQSMDQLAYAKGCLDTLERIVNHDKVVTAMAEQEELPFDGDAP